MLFRSEQVYADTHNDLNARLFISVGGLEELEGHPQASYAMVSNMHRMADTLAGRTYPSLFVEKVEFPQETHVSVIPATLSRGLREVFRTD